MASTMNKIVFFAGDFAPVQWEKFGEPLLDVNKKPVSCIRQKEGEDYCFYGQIVPFTGDFAPRGWAFCEGQILEVSQHGTLFSILSGRYGGNGYLNFALPNLKEKLKSGKKEIKYIICMDGMFPKRR